MSQSMLCDEHAQPLLIEPISKQIQTQNNCSLCLSEFDKEQYCEKISQLIIDLIHELNGLQNDISSIQENNFCCIQLVDGIVLEGPIQHGLKHGDYYYKFNDGTKQYVFICNKKAGLYDSDNKKGVWNDIASFNYEMDEYSINENYFNIKIKKRRMNTFLYNSELSFVGYRRDIKIQNMVQKDFFVGRIGIYHQLQFQGKLINNLKIGQWQILYQGQVCGGGNFNSKGQKTGVWTEVIDKYNTKYSLTYTGEYKNGKKIGKWKTLYKGFEIGGGNYEPNEVKSGKWIIHHDNYCNKCLITYHGVYKNGLRYGLWQTLSQDIEIGRGNYNEKGEKSDEWIEIHHNYDNYCQVIYSGTYKDGIKIGFWKILSEEQELGGGYYDNQGNKHGEWIELHENYNFANTVKYSGIYQNGIKTGKWITLLGDEEIGGGNYDEQGIKSGHWIDLHDNYQEDNPIRYSGEYTNGLRTGVWEVYEEKKKIDAGGFYNEKGFKSGPWIDIHDEYCFLCRLFYSGEYDNGIKIGNWKTLFDEDQTYVFIHGSGDYNEKGAKTGEWIELHEKYYEQCPVKYRGKYEDGIRTGKWATLSEGLEIGGSYNENGIKTGPWIDLHDNYYNGCKVKHSGEYTNGQRTGQWEIICDVKQLGGGSYDEMGAKTGQWIELHENFYDFCRLVQAGEYKSGVKIGKWTILQDQKQIGGGDYNENGVKIGHWIEANNNFTYFNKVLYSGEYKDGLRIGIWSETIDSVTKPFANYNDQGVIQ